MNNMHYAEAVRLTVQPAFGRKKSIPSKYVPLYPKNSERELKSLTNAYMKILKKEINDHLPEIMAAYKRSRRTDSREDGIFDLTQELGRIFQDIGRSVEKKLSEFGLRGRIEKVAKRTQGTSYAEWKKCVQKTVGLDLIDNYYSKDFYSSIMQPWIDNSGSMIQSITQQELGTMRSIISDGFRDELPIEDIAKNIQGEYNTSKSKAMFLARDQIGTLNSELTRRQHEDAGVSRYRWVDSGDGRVRDCHHSLNGRVFRWDDPPAMWTRRNGAVVFTGRRCHPGQDYGCRCHAVPVFDIDTLDLPIQGANK